MSNDFMYPPVPTGDALMTTGGIIPDGKGILFNGLLIFGLGLSLGLLIGYNFPEIRKMFDQVPAVE